MFVFPFQKLRKARSEFVEGKNLKIGGEINFSSEFFTMSVIVDWQVPSGDQLILINQ
jgi:hypothetical protein